MEFQTPTISVDDLRRFHARHFPNAPVPEQYPQEEHREPQDAWYDGDNDLGYYEDGVKRTLNDEEIAIFRHSEIQRILLERKRRKEAGEPIFDTHSPHIDTAETLSLPRDSATGAVSPVSNQSTPMSISSDDDHTPATATKQPQQKWATTSERSRLRNAKNRQKNRKNYRERKKEERKRQEREAKDAKRRRVQQEQRDQDDESDEWDPWHQANGPDAQKEDAVDLDY